MGKVFNRMLSILLVLTMVFQLLPLNCFSLEVTADENIEQVIDTSITEPSSAEDTDSYERLETAQIVEEDISKRDESYKEFILNNGLRMAALYPSPVHYEKDGQWEEIDNTLKASGANYVNTAGVWEVSFPQNLSKNNAVTIEKDGYTLSFFMAGELCGGSGNLEVAPMATIGVDETFSVQAIQAAPAQIQQIDASAMKAEMKHPEMLVEKGHSRLQYSNVYSGTNVVYDLSSNQVKESIVMQSYSANLRGYRYTLNVGELRPVLTESGEIQLYDRDGENVIMVMPAPFLVDNAGEYTFGVDVTLTGTGSVYTLTYLLPQSWLANSERQWPVVLDPIVSANMDKSNIRDVSVYEQNCPETYLSGILDVGHNTTYGIMRTFMKYRNLPALTSADVVVDAQLWLIKPNNHSTTNAVEVHKVVETWESESTTWNDQPEINATVEDYAIVQNAGVYQWEITDIVRGWYQNENTGLALMAPDSIENTSSTSSYRKQFYSADYSADTRPTLTITYRNNNGLESYWDYTASSAGRAGTGYVNNYTGNLVWVHNDIGYGGNLMPVSISHVYNANDSKNNNCGMGYGWRTNFNQTVSTCELPLGTETILWYVWTDSDGTKHYFYSTDDETYQDEDGLELTLTPGTGGFACVIEDKYGNTSHFDSKGRLYQMVNNQDDKSEITVTYSATNSFLISSVTDGVGRKYNYMYTNGLLTRISYTGNGSSEVGFIAFTYSENRLTGITYQDGKTVTYGYGASNLLTTITDVDGYQLVYTYNTVTDANSYQPYRVQSVAEYDGTKAGGSLTIVYGHNQTTFTDRAGNVQIMQFNNWGNTVSIQDGLGRAQFATYNPTIEATDKGNQLALSSKLQNTVASFLKENSFENGDYWTDINDNSSHAVVSNYAYLGAKCLRMITANAGDGIYSNSFILHPGQTYTFSAYVLTSGSATAYLALSNGTTVLAESEVIYSQGEWTRYEVSYTNDATSTCTLRAQLMSGTAGTVYMDCTQVEATETASRYNIIENGNFNHGELNWIKSEKADEDETTVTTSSRATPLLGSPVFQIVGEPENKLRIRQEVPVSGVKDDTYVLAGWAKGDGVPLPSAEERQAIIDAGEYPRTFTIRGTFLYTDGTTGEFNFDFNPDQPNWQYVAGVMVAEKAYSGIKVQVLYDYNANTVLFDGIQLYKEEFGNSYTYDENGNVISVKDLQGQITEYEYESNNVDLKRIIQDNKAKVTYTYDDWHNVKTATTEEGIVYSFDYDDYGNNTSVSIEYDGGKITSSAYYTTDGNRLDYTVDALGKMTKYSYNAATNVLEWVEAPNDSEATRTNYTYDDMYRVATVSANVAGLSEGTALTATYGYTDDLLTSITTGSTTYTFNYGDFAQRSSIQIGTQTLASYEYNQYELTDNDVSNDNNYLNRLVYGNGNVIEYTYDKYGRLAAQAYKANGDATTGDTVTYKYDNSGGLSTVIDSSSGITTKYFYDVTDRLMKYTETGTDFNHSVAYTYDNLNNLTSLEEKINDLTLTSNYTYDSDNRVIKVENGSAVRDYTYDGYGRLDRRVTSSGTTTYLTEDFVFHTSGGNDTGQLKSQHFTTADRNISYSYTYDGNGNIASVTESATSPRASIPSVTTTTYVYDSQNQLIRENNEMASKTWVWTYDNAGNITSRTEYEYSVDTLGEPLDTVVYGYTDPDWGDLLTSYDGKTITYDNICNPLTDGTWTYTWEHGRQLATMTNGTTTWTYSYDVNGMRTSRSNGTTTYTYVYNGGLLSQMTVGTDVLTFSYDTSGTPMTVTYNDVVYYYVTNVQGDVIAILDSNGSAVVGYTYDAWGKLLVESDLDGIGRINPLLYRGYVYDRETKLYYLVSRYYSSSLGRFISPDGYASTGQGLLGSNMFAYCGNNPVNRKDSSGNSWLLAVFVIVVCAVVMTGCSEQPESDVGAAQPYVDMPGSSDPSSPNCYAYAIGSPVNEQPGETSGRTPTNWNDVNDVGKSVEEDLKAKGYTVREISGPDAKVYDNEFKIALRVGTRPYAYNPYTGEFFYDYHFMRQTDTGRWAEKHGYGGASVCWDLGMTPDTIPWTLNGVPYYDSAIIYYAVGT